MTTEHSTYTDEGGAQETVTLKRGPLTPHGHAILKINYSDGKTVDCYVNTAWLRDRLDDLGEPRLPSLDTDGDTSVDYHAMWWKAEREREKAEQERDEALRTVQEVVDSHDETLRDIAAGKYAAEPRPLAPGAITDEVVRLVQERIKRRATYIPAETIRLALEDAFAPARPEGAEDVAVRLFQAGAAVGVEMTAEQRDALADHLAAMHVRVVAEGEN